jgi:hypothetical protein
LHHVVNDAPDLLFRALQKAPHRTGRIQHEYHFKRLPAFARLLCQRFLDHDRLHLPEKRNAGERDSHAERQQHYRKIYQFPFH